MKRVITLLLAASMILGAASIASAAVNFKASGQLQTTLGVQDNNGWNKDAKEDNFHAYSRFRPRLTMTAGAAKAVYELQVQNDVWGRDGYDANSAKNTSPNAQYRTRLMYVDFDIPSTKVNLKAGIQQLTLPSIWGHPVYNARSGAVLATIPVTDEIAIQAFYSRPWDKKPGGAIDPNYNSTDMYGVMAPLNFGMASVKPYFVYVRGGLNSGVPGGTSVNDSATMLIGGANIAIMPNDSLSVKVDALFTNLSSDVDAVDNIGMGWMVAFAVDYAMPFGTPGLLGWYSPGADDEGKDYLHSLKTGGFSPTSLGYADNYGMGSGERIGTSGANSMGIGLQVADLSFLDGIKHVARVAYVMGTADKKFAATSTNDFWTEDDSFIEFNFNTTWAMYENLTCVAELGAILPDIDKGDREDTHLLGNVSFRFSF